MQKMKRGTSGTADIPELTDAELKRARRVTPKETEAFRRAIEDKLGISRPPRMGRPPKDPSERCVPISWRTPPEVKDWLVAQARHAGIGKYQKFLSILLRGMMRYEAVREKNGITLRLPNSDHVIVIAFETPPSRAARPGQRGGESSAEAARNRIPKFKSEADERAFWTVHDSADYVAWKKGKKADFSNLKPSHKPVALSSKAGPKRIRR
jgi:hypothetical protein